MSASFANAAVGAELPALVLPPITRHMLALYCGASGDHNPLHTDIDFAHRAGLPDVIAHGMFTMALVSRMLTRWAPQNRLRAYGVRFVGQVTIGDVVTCEAVVAEIREHADGRRAHLQLTARKQSGEQVLVGDAEVSLG